MAAAIGLLAVALRFEAERKGSGVGAVLDTTQNMAKTEVQQLQAQLDAACSSNERSHVLEELRIKLQRARDLEAMSRNRNEVVFSKLHVQGAAYRSGMVDSGDVLLEVDGRRIGSDLDLAGSLVRGDMHSSVTLKVRKRDGRELAVTLKRAYISGHPTNEAPISVLGL